MSGSEPVHVITRSDASDAEIDSAFTWMFQRRKVIAAILAVMTAGGTAAYHGLKQIEATAEERVLRRQAAERQAKAVKSNGESVRRLHDRMEAVEDAVAQNAEMARTTMQLMMASPSVKRAVSRDKSLKRRAAKFVAGQD